MIIGDTFVYLIGQTCGLRLALGISFSSIGQMCIQSVLDGGVQYDNTTDYIKFY